MKKILLDVLRSYEIQRALSLSLNSLLLIKFIKYYINLNLLNAIIIRIIKL